MPVTLADARTLLERALTHTANPAVLRLPESERTVEGLARAYLPRSLWVPGEGEGYDLRTGPAVRRVGQGLLVRSTRMDLSDPGTAHALLVALALALGRDPGVAGLGVMWERAGECWLLTTTSQSVAFEPADDDYGIAEGDSTIACLSWLCAPTVAAEPDPIKAFALAVHHVIAEKEAP